MESALDPLSSYTEPAVKVYVSAPSTLPAGYTFEATAQGFDDYSFSVTVPEGGVTAGQDILVELPRDFKAERIHSPTGRWKDGMLSFFSYGFFHSSLWCACCCTQLAMAQVMTRMRLTFLGEPGSIESTKNTFTIVATLFASYTIYSIALEIAAPTPQSADDPKIDPIVSFLKAIGGVFFTLYVIYALMKTRQFVRNKYSIPEGRLGACEDLICSVACSCCTIAQMARHTGEYEKYSGKCFSTKGLPESAPLNV